MRIQLSGPTREKLRGKVSITGSKSESNRLLLLRAFFPNIRIENLSNSDDSRVMQVALASQEELVDIHHAGTAMRFLTAYFAGLEGREVILTGSRRMKQRPIRILVDSLRSMGASIEYLESPGCPPIRIRGVRLVKKTVTLPADVSSQYISALLLIGPSLSNGIELTLEGRITSLPYIRMTLALLTRLGIENEMEGNQIRVYPVQKLPSRSVKVESDWSSASYHYSMAALSGVGSRITLSSYRKDSLQGDSVLQEIFTDLGVTSEFKGDQLILTRREVAVVSHLEVDLIQAPDLAQTLAACCFGLGISCDLTGLHTLKIKETDRLEALKTELTKLGAEVCVTESSLHLKAGGVVRPGQSIATYHDHRMAMAFAPLGLKADIIIEDPGVVSKSYPGFWEVLTDLGFRIREVGHEF